jgi:hypothetical protein
VDVTPVPDAGGPRSSVVLPAYNEERRLPAHLRAVLDHFVGMGEEYWVDRPGSNVGVLTHGPRMVLEILRVRRRLTARERQSEGMAS